MNERVSALLDDMLDEEATGRVLDALKRDRGLRQQWDSYCLIGDVLRDEQALSPAFTHRVMLCLDDEPTVLAPVRRESSGVFQRLMPVAASVMGVAAVAWVALTLNHSGPDALRVASVARPALTQVAAPAPSAVSGEMAEREYLFAHQAMAPSAAMPGVAQYVRSVADFRLTAQK